MPFKLTAPCLGRELGDRPLPAAVRSGLLVATALGGLSIAAAGQEASPSKEFAPSGARPAPKTELSYLRTPQKPRLVGLRGFTLITPCHRHHHCAEWSCVVLSRWSRHRNGSGRDWPHKATMRQLGSVNAVTLIAGNPM